MKKIKFIFLIVVFNICFNSGTILGQQEFSLVTSSTSNILFDDDYLFVFSEDKEVESNLNIAKASDAKFLEKNYDDNVLADFGAYLNPISNTMKVKSQKSIVYEKIQLTNTDTGKVVISEKMAANNSIVDLSSLESGNYIMILTDDKNHIYSEKFSVY